MLRSEYMAASLEDQPQAHRAYYGQFVDDFLKETIARNFGVDRLKRAFARDEHFNTIPLIEWDAYNPLFTQLDSLPKAVRNVGDQWSMSTSVCIVKEAARQVVEENQ